MSSSVLNILLVDDEPMLLEIMGTALRGHGHTVEVARDGAEALVAATQRPFDAVVCDVRMPEVDGITLLKRIKSHAPRTPVILMTAYAGVQEAVTALRYGAFDYLSKPFGIRELLARLAKIPLGPPAQAASTAARPDAELFGDSGAMVRLRETVARFAATAEPVLVTGESGTGKELVSRALHAGSARRSGPFVAVNCASFPETLLEAELFGHEKGAFTGAVRKREGRFKAADGGTLLLDEVGELPLTAQAKLLRVLQERRFEPLGTNQSQVVDVRVISATHRNLRELITQGRFREDLYYRLKILELQVPALRDRAGDVPVLAQTFLERFATPTSPRRVSPAALALLESYAFPGNVRELEHAIRHAMVLANGVAEVDLEHLPPDITAAQLAEASAASVRPLHDALAIYEREYLLRALTLAGGKRQATADLLGISRKNLWERLRRHTIAEFVTDASPDEEPPDSEPPADG